MVNVNGHSKFSFNHFAGPLLDDDAPYCGLIMHELKILSPSIRTSLNDELDPFPSAVGHLTHWQYGTGTHSSNSRRFSGSVLIRARLNDGTDLIIRHIVIEGSSQWPIGRNVSTICDIIHTNGNYLKLLNKATIPLQNVGIHSYVSSYIFLDQTNINCSAFDAMLFCVESWAG